MEFFNKLSKYHIGMPLVLFFLYIHFVSSLLFEYYLNFEPTYLCLAKRYCSVICIFSITVALLVKREKIRLKFIDFSCVFLFWGVGFSFYHLLVQYNFLNEPYFFRKTFPVNASLQQIREIIKANELSSFAKIEPSFLGMPVSFFVFIMFVFLFVYLLCCFKNKMSASTD